MLKNAWEKLLLNLRLTFHRAISWIATWASPGPTKRDLLIAQTWLTSSCIEWEQYLEETLEIALREGFYPSMEFWLENVRAEAQFIKTVKSEADEFLEMVPLEEGWKIYMEGIGDQDYLDFYYGPDLDDEE